MDYGTNLKAVREKAGFTQPQLAELLGVSKSFITQLEKGTKSISLRNAELIAKICNCKIDDLVTQETKTA